MEVTLISKELRRQLLAYLLRRVSNRADAEDILQSVLLKVHNAPQLANPDAIHGWILQVTRNTVIDYYRSRKPNEPLPDNVVSGNAEEDSADAPLLACMRQMVGRLPETYREALVLSDLEGVPQKEVAERLGVGLSGAKSRIQRGREKLRELVQTCCHLELDAYGNAVEQICQNAGCTCCH